MLIEGVEFMRKRLGILVLALCLLFPQITVNAKESANGLSGYVNLLMSKVKGNNGGESLSSLEDSLEEVIQNIKPEDAKKILDFVSEKIQDGSWESKQGIENAIKEAEQKFDVTLTEEHKELVFSVAEKVKKLGIDPQFLVDQAEDIYKKYSKEIKDEVNQKTEEIVEEVQKKVKEEITRSLTDYVSDMVANIKSFIKGIFTR